MKTTVLLIDDHQVVLDGLQSLIGKMKEFQVVGTAKNGWEALDFLSTLPHPDIFLMDITMPELDGLETMQKLSELEEAPSVIMLSMHLSGSMAQRLLALGARGYLQKDCDLSELQDALYTIRDGGTYLSKNITELLVSEANTPGANEEVKAPLLSPRETEVLKLLQQEMSSKQIGKELGITFHTVETHRKHLLNKFAVSSTIGLIREAMRCGLLV